MLRTGSGLFLAGLLLAPGCRLLAPDAPCVTDDNCRSTARCEEGLCVPVPALPGGDGGRLDDAGRVDAGPGGDVDSGSPGRDGGFDAGVRDDAGPPASDAGLDAGVRDDAGPPAPDAGPLPDPDTPLLLYRFNEGAGDVVRDTSGVGAPLDLQIDNVANVTWAPGSLTFDVNAIASSVTPAAKLQDACGGAAGLTVELWATPANASQFGPARIVTLSRTPSQRNFTLGQTQATWATRIRNATAVAGAVDYQESFSPDGTLVAGALHHVVWVYDGAGANRLYVDDVLQIDVAGGGDFGAWHADQVFAIGNEITLDRTWLGTVEQVAVWCRALPEERVAARFLAGPLPD